MFPIAHGRISIGDLFRSHTPVYATELRLHLTLFELVDITKTVRFRSPLPSSFILAHNGKTHLPAITPFSQVKLPVNGALIVVIYAQKLLK